MKRFISIILIICTLASFTIIANAENGVKSGAESSYFLNGDIDLRLPEGIGGVYLCEARTGTVLYAKNEFYRSSPASVTKIMTLLLVCEALNSGSFALSDKVRVSAKAASMGGSQVFLEEGEIITVEELIKSAVIASGNDASVALAELTCGSEGAFVDLMNKKASELGLENTHFENCTGLDDTTVEHYSCAGDIAKMSRELIKHDLILKYSSLWQDSIRDGEFILTNTNRLVRYYEGCNGLKTGSTDKAGYCVSVTARRGNMTLIAVVMGADSKEDRNTAARAMLDYGFSSFALFEDEGGFLENVAVRGGVADEIGLYRRPFYCLVKKSELGNIQKSYDIPDYLNAPLKSEDRVGSIGYSIGGDRLGTADIYVNQGVDRISFPSLILRIIKRMVIG